jgi:hypothetical protein
MHSIFNYIEHILKYVNLFFKMDHNILKPIFIIYRIYKHATYEEGNQYFNS